MASSMPDYVFTRDYLDNNRIVWLSDASVNPDKQTHMRIADVGTGTAVWLTGLASHLPNTVQFDGLDVSFSAAPPAQWLPTNVTLRHWNIKEPVPTELLGVYDVVHIRNFAFVLHNSDVPGVLERLVSLLRPGGVLQWVEPDVSTFRIETVDTTITTDALTRLLTVSQSQDKRLSPTWVPQLPILRRAAGLVEIGADVRDASPSLALAMHECNLIIHELVARKSMSQDVMEAIRDLMPRVEAETRQGACWAFTRWTVVAQKKSEENQ